VTGLTISAVGHPPSAASGGSSTAIFDAWLREHAAGLGLAETVVRRVRKSHGFVPAGVLELATQWACTMSAAVFFSALRELQPEYSDLLMQVRQRASQLLEQVAAQVKAGVAQ
jgi:hypothetical protein